MYTCRLARQFAVLGILCCLVLLACASAPPTAVQREAAKYFVSPTKEIQLLFPDVAVERMVSKAPASPMGSGLRWSEEPTVTVNIKAIAERIQTLAADDARGKGLAVTIREPLGVEGRVLPGPSGIPESFAKQLVRPNLNSGRAFELLQEVCGGSPTAAMLVHYIELIVGSEEGWTVVGLPPFAFAMTPRAGLRTSYVRAVLRDCGTGELLWHNEVFLRALPETEPALFEESVKSLYQNFLTR